MDPIAVIIIFSITALALTAVALKRALRQVITDNEEIVVSYVNPFRGLFIEYEMNKKNPLKQKLNFNKDKKIIYHAYGWRVDAVEVTWPGGKIEREERKDAKTEKALEAWTGTKLSFDGQFKEIVENFRLRKTAMAYLEPER